MQDAISSYSAAAVQPFWPQCTKCGRYARMNALYHFETMHWPDMPAKTRMHLTTPEIPLKLSAILRAAWVSYHPRLNLALAALVRFKARFLENSTQSLIATRSPS